MPSEDKPKSNMDIAVDALKAEAAAEVIKSNPNWMKMEALTQFLRTQRYVPDLADAVREEITAASIDNPGVGEYVNSDGSFPTNNFMPFDRMRRVRSPSLSPMPVIPPEVQSLIDRVIEISPFQADKAKKMLECANLLDSSEAFNVEGKSYAGVKEFTAKLREKAMDILRPEFGDLPEEIKPAIRKLDLEDEEGHIDAEFEAK